MSDDVKAHLFERFFTTKAVGHGTSLGLATVFGIVHSMDGFIEVDSRVGAGTTMRVFLPETSAAAEAAAFVPTAKRRVVYPTLRATTTCTSTSAVNARSKKSPV